MESTSTRRRRIDKDVSIDEMSRMRERGMSNKDIAKSLEISYATVLKYIGKQGRKMGQMAAFTERAVLPQSKERARMELSKPQETFAYSDFLASLDYDGKTALISVRGEDGISVRMDDLPIFAQFVVSVAYKGGSTNAQ